MLERDITSQNGILSKHLPQGTYWLRLPDSMKASQHAKPCDGFLWLKNRCWPVEVKINSGKLTGGELKYAEKCVANKTEYVVLRYFEKYNMWSVEIFGYNITSENTNLKDCLEWVIYRD